MPLYKSGLFSCFINLPSLNLDFRPRSPLSHPPHSIVTDSTFSLTIIHAWQAARHPSPGERGLLFLVLCLGQHHWYPRSPSVSPLYLYCTIRSAYPGCLLSSCNILYIYSINPDCAARRIATVLVGIYMDIECPFCVRASVPLVG